MASTSPLYPLWDPYIKALSPVPSGGMLFQFPSVNAVREDSERTWQFIDTLVAGITARLVTDGDNAAYGPPARLEFFSDSAAELRGMVLFDSYGTPVVHCPHVMIGHGSPEKLANRLMDLLDVPLSLQRQVQSNPVNGKAHCLIITRESSCTESGVEIATSSADVSDTWRHMFVKPVELTVAQRRAARMLGVR